MLICLRVIYIHYDYLVYMGLHHRFIAIIYFRTVYYTIFYDYLQLFQK